MKKLMTVLASAATALFAIGVAKGDGFTPQGTGFEDYSEGAVFDAQKDDAGGTSGDKYWYSTASAGEIGDISNHVGTVAAALVPDYFENAGIGNRYLHIDTSAPLFRTAVANIQGAESQEDFFSPTNNFVTPVDIGTGIYLDTLVQFTAADDAFQTDLDSGDKIAISYVEHEDDETTTDVNEAWTNFVIRAGQIVGESLIIQNNYFAAVPEGFDKDAWHRLTVRSIKLSDKQAAFIIYLDGDMTKALSYSTDVDAGFGTLTSPASDYYNTERHALYPSAVGTGDNITTISAASFSGTGALDDVVFTTTKPSFIQEAQTITVAWDDAHVASVTINGVAVTAEELAAGRKVIDYVGTVLVSATFAQGYEADYSKYTVAPPGAGSWNAATGGFVNLQPNAVCTIASMQPKFDVNGVHYDNIEAAMTAAAAGTVQNPATLKLLADYDDVLAFDGGVIILDLAGCDVQGGETADFSIVNAGATLTITNSGAEASVKLPVRDPEDPVPPAGVMMASTLTVVQAGTFEGVIITPAMTDEELTPKDYLVITGGKFLDAAYDPEDPEAPFYLAAYVDNGLALTQDGEYVIVGEGEEPPAPTTYELTIPEVKIADVTAATAAVTAGGEPVANLAAIPAGTVVTVTWTAAEGYKITAGDTENITMSENKTAAVPTVAAITYATLTITQVDNCTIVVSNATEEVVSGATFDVDAEIELTVYRTPAAGYVLDNCAATETITMDQDQTVTAAVKVSGGYPSYIDDATKQGKYDTWKDAMTTAGVDVGDGEAYEDAYLLNCKPAEVEAEVAAFKFTKIAFEGGAWVTETTTKNTNGANYNGEVVVTRYSDVGCTTKSENGSFFKAELK